MQVQILREMAVAFGLGSKRPKEKKKQDVRPRQGTVGEDVTVDEQGNIKLRMPGRLGVGTVKGAAWQVGHCEIYLSGHRQFCT